MLTKIISLSLISCLYLQNFVTPLKPCVYKNDKSVYVENSNEPQYEYYGKQYKLVASLPDKDIKLFARTSCGYPGLYDEFVLSVNEKTKRFTNWKSATSFFRPKLILSDINNDKVEELIIILTTGTGSDVHMEEIHILDMDFNEYLIANPLIIIKGNVNTKMTQKENDVLIQVKLNDEEYNIKKDKSDAGVWFKDVAFGGIIHWKVINDKLYAHIDAQVSPSGFVGTVIIEYKFENNVFTLDSISFEESAQF